MTDEEHMQSCQHLPPACFMTLVLCLQTIESLLGHKPTHSSWAAGHAVPSSSLHSILRGTMLLSRAPFAELNTCVQAMQCTAAA